MQNTVITLGVFDCFHIGHLKALSKSFNFGEILIVGIQSDKAVQKQKGKMPVASENERRDIINALKIVSDTFIYSTVDDIPKDIKFDIFSHCQDINRQTLTNMKEKFFDKKFLSFPRTLGVSSTFRRSSRLDNNQRIAVDYHDTFTASPEAITAILQGFKPENIFILTGTPNSRTNVIRDDLHRRQVPFAKVIGGFEYETMGKKHFEKMAAWKTKELINYKIDIYIDDNPFYVNFVKNTLPNVLILQNILSPKYLLQFSGKHMDFTANLQTKQFDFLKLLSPDK
jgi:glycerol-3-phosphate cytidylyltransferase